MPKTFQFKRLIIFYHLVSWNVILKDLDGLWFFIVKKKKSRRILLLTYNFNSCVVSWLVHQCSASVPLIKIQKISISKTYSNGE